MGDLGINATTSIIEDLKRKVKEQHIKDPAECKELLIESIKEEMNVGETAYEFENRTSVVLVIGVNGVGKTTQYRQAGGQAQGPGQKSGSGCGRHLPRGGRGAAGRAGQTGPVWRSSAVRRVPTREPLSTTPSRRPRQDMRTFFWWTPQEDSTTRKTLWRSLESSTGSLKKNIRKLTARPW